MDTPLATGTDTRPTRRKLPIGIQTFREIRENDHYYVDKSGMAVDLIEAGKHYFLSRPRRFGKSLLLDTLKALFEGERALFEGLAAETRWDWTRRHPVIRISFADGVAQAAMGLDHRIRRNLRVNRVAKTAIDVFGDILAKEKLDRNDLRLIIEQDMYPAPPGSAKAIATRTRDYFGGLGLVPAQR